MKMSSQIGGLLISDANVVTYVADAFNNCNTTPLQQCLIINIPGYQPGQGVNHGKGDPTPTPTPFATPMAVPPALPTATSTPSPHTPPGRPTPIPRI